MSKKIEKIRFKYENTKLKIQKRKIKDSQILGTSVVFKSIKNLNSVYHLL